MTNRTSTLTKQIIWTCEVCNLPIANDKGAVFVRFSERRAYRDDGDARKRKQANTTPASPGRQLIITSVKSDLMDLIPLAPWHVMHDKCDLEPGDCAYWLRVDAMRTMFAVLSITKHLLEKAWLNETRWDTLLERVIYDPINTAAREHSP